MFSSLHTRQTSAEETPDTPPLASDETIAPRSDRESNHPPLFDASTGCSSTQVPRLLPSPVIPSKHTTLSRRADDTPSDESELLSPRPNTARDAASRLQPVELRGPQHQRQETSLKISTRLACLALVVLLCVVALLSASNTADGFSANVSLTVEANVTLSKKEQLPGPTAAGPSSHPVVPRSPTTATSPTSPIPSTSPQSWMAPPKDQRVVSSETKSAVFAPITKDSFDPSKVAQELLASRLVESSVRPSFDYFYVPRRVKDPSAKYPGGARRSCRFVNKKGSKQVSKFHQTPIPPGGCGADFNLASDLHLPPPVSWQNVLRNRARFSRGVPADSVTSFRKWLDGQAVHSMPDANLMNPPDRTNASNVSATSIGATGISFDVRNVNVRPLSTLPECPFGRPPFKTLEPDVSSYAQDTYQIAHFFSTVAADAGWAVVPVAGTGLGALRHGGMLPGDDDLDINLYPPLWVVERTAQFEDAGLAWTFIYDAFDDLIVRRRSENTQQSASAQSTGPNDYNDHNARPFNWYRTTFGPLTANKHPTVHPLVFFKSDAGFKEFKGKPGKPCAAHYVQDEAAEERRMFFGGCMPPHFFICLQAPQFFYTPARSLPFSFPLIRRGTDYLEVAAQHAYGKPLIAAPKNLRSGTTSRRLQQNERDSGPRLEYITIFLSVKQAVRPTPAFYTSFALRPTGPMCRCQFMPHGDTRATAPWMVCPAALPSFVRKWYGERWCIPAGAVETGAAAVLKTWED